MTTARLAATLLALLVLGGPSPLRAEANGADGDSAAVAPATPRTFSRTPT